jgi:hypothetical protein
MRRISCLVEDKLWSETHRQDEWRHCVVSQFRHTSSSAYKRNDWMRRRCDRWKQHARNPPLASVEGPLGAIRQLDDVAVCIHRMELPCLAVCRVAMTASSTMRRASVLTVGVKEGVPTTSILIPAGAKQVKNSCESTMAQRAADSMLERTRSRLRCGRKKNLERYSLCATCKALTTSVRLRQHSTASQSRALHSLSVVAVNDELTRFMAHNIMVLGLTDCPEPLV